MKLRKTLLLIIPTLCIVGCNKTTTESKEKNVYLYFGDNISRVEKVNVGEQYYAPTNVIKTGYNFEGWYLNSACTSYLKIKFPVIIEDDLSLYANYNIKKFTVTYNLNDEDAAVDAITKSIFWGERVLDLDPTIYGPEGKTFECWYKEAECKNKYNFEKEYAYSNINLYAKWIE